MVQIRITIPQWVAELKGWDKESKIEIVPLVRDDDKTINKKTAFILKEVKRNGK